MSAESLPPKRCPRCKHSFPRETHYSKCKGSKDGFSGYCKKCAKKKHAEWVDTNRDDLKAYRRKHRKEHPESYSGEYAHKKTNTPDTLRANWRRRYARKHGAIGEHTATDIDCLYINQRGLCAYCGCKLNGKYHVDHIIPLSRGGSNNADNLTLTCARCNLSKGDKLLSEWREMPSCSS